MKYFWLIWAALVRSKIRSVLTLLSIVVAFLLFGLLDSVRNTFEDYGQSTSGFRTLITFSKTTPGAPLPVSMYDRIRGIPGITDVDHVFNISGTYRDPKNSILIESHTAAVFGFPELKVTAEERESFLRTRTGALVGKRLLKKMGWRIGERIPIKTSVMREDGSDVWTFDIVGTYGFDDPGMKVYESQLFINWEPFDQARRADKGMVHYFVSMVANLSDVDWSAQTIDALSENSGHETKTQSDNALMAEMVRQRGDVGLIVVLIMGAVFFALLLVAGHTMAHSVRERMPELAVLKTIGFGRRKIMALVLGESVLLVVLGSAIGLGIATLAVIGWQSVLEGALQMPMTPVGNGVWLRGLTYAAAIGLVVGLLPALRGLNLRITDALARR